MKWAAVIGGVALAALASLPAGAADITPGAQPAIPARSAYIPVRFMWTGFYLGAGVGYASGSASFNDPFVAPTVGSPLYKGLLVPGIMGLNYQFDTVVLGVEGDFTGSWMKGSTIDSTGNNLQTEIFWTASITGRLGLAFDRVLLYGKGGVAFDYDRDTVLVLPGGTQAQGSTNRVGWSVGGGVEYAVTEHWTARLEYDHFKFPVKGFILQGSTIPPSITGGVGLTFNELKGIMAYKF